MNILYTLPQIDWSAAAAPDFGPRLPKTRKIGLLAAAKTTIYCIQCPCGYNILRFRESDLTLVGCGSSMQFLVCRKVLPYKGLWQMLNSSIASMKGV